MSPAFLGIVYAVGALAAAMYNERLWRAGRGFTKASLVTWIASAMFVALSIGALRAPNAPAWQLIALGGFCGLLTFGYLWGTQRHRR